MQMKPLLAIVFALVGVFVWLSLFTVREDQRVIRFQFGEVVETGYEPGLHFKPFWQDVRFFDARVQTLDEQPERFLTSEKKNVIVDSFVKWRIGDVSTFYTTVSGDVARANLRLRELIREGLREEFSKRTVQEVISGERSQIMDVLFSQVSKSAQSLGIEVVDVRLKRVDLPDDVSESVFSRMTAEREHVAREFRARGREQAERIRAEVDRQRAVILAEAYRDAEQLRGEGDALAADIYAKAYSANEEFYSFYRSLGAYTRSFDGGQDVMVLSPNSEFFKYFQQMRIDSK